jgi:hypothetical protein
MAKKSSKKSTGKKTTKKKTTRKKSVRKKRENKPFIFEEEFIKFVLLLKKNNQTRRSFREEFWEQVQYLDNVGLPDYTNIFIHKNNTQAAFGTSKKDQFYNVFFESSEGFNSLVEGLNQSIIWFDNLNKERIEKYETESTQVFDEEKQKYHNEPTKDCLSLEEYLTNGRQKPIYLDFMYKTLKENQLIIYNKLLKTELYPDLHKIVKLLEKHDLEYTNLCSKLIIANLNKLIKTILDHVDLIKDKKEFMKLINDITTNLRDLEEQNKKIIDLRYSFIETGSLKDKDLIRIKLFEGEKEGKRINPYIELDSDGSEFVVNIMIEKFGKSWIDDILEREFS